MSTSKLSGLKIIRKQNFSDEELLNFAQGLSDKSGELKEKVLHWDFGPIMDMKFNPEAPNYLFSSENVPLHWDGAFYKEPSYLLFYCTETSGTGGETLFLNTELLWDSLTADEKEECSKIVLKYSTEKKAHYGGEITVPLVQTHPLTGKTILRIAQKVETTLNPVTLTIMGATDAADFYQRMEQKLSDPRFLYTHEWEKGDVVICDNFTYLHGRKALKGNLTRSFKRIQIL
jgi:alpha-ketoglutarate-dependent taurine dioxygenase